MEDDSLKQIRTYQGDVADALGNQKESLVSIQRKEVARQADAPRPVKTEGESGVKKAIMFLIGTLALLGIAGAIGFYSYNTYKEKTALPAVAPPANRFISAERIFEISGEKLDKATLNQYVTSEIQALSNTATGTIEHLQFYTAAATTTLLTTDRFFQVLNTQAPGSLIRSFGPHFMYGFVASQTPSGFLILKLQSFANAFPGMLTWEKTMAQDIGSLFYTRDLVQNIPPGTSFTDTTIKNRDARILRDEIGNTILVYSFYSNELLIITDSVDTLLGLESRLRSEELSR